MLADLFPEIVDFGETKDLVRNSINSRKPEIVIEKIDQANLSKFLVRSTDFEASQL